MGYIKFTLWIRQNERHGHAAAVTGGPRVLADVAGRLGSPRRHVSPRTRRTQTEASLADWTRERVGLGSETFPCSFLSVAFPEQDQTTIAREVARALAAVYLRIDSIEQAMRGAGWQVESEGYHVAAVVAEDNLRLGRIVVTDCVNPWPLTRAEWRAMAERAGVPALDVEVVCSDRDEPRRRVEARTPDIGGHRLPTWQEVIEPDYRAGIPNGS